MIGLRHTLGRIKVGIGLARDGVLVLRHHPKLAVLPLLSGVAAVGYLLALLAPALLLESTVGFQQLGEAGLYATLFVWYFGTAFIAAFFNAALVHATGDVFEDREPNLGRSLRAATGELRMLLVWAFASAVVGVVLRALESSDSVVGDVVAAIVSFGWTVTTFFVLPVIVFEDHGIRETFAESGRTFRETWGEAIGVGAGVSLTVGIATFVLFVAAVAVGGTVASVPGAVLLGLVVLLLGYLAYVTVWGVVKTALYGYAKTGKTPSEFEDLDFSRLEDAGN